MGSSASHAAAPPSPAPVAPPPTPPVGLAQLIPQKTKENGDGKGAPAKVDWLGLPCPVPYEELQREALTTQGELLLLKKVLLEGQVRFTNDLVVIRSDGWSASHFLRQEVSLKPELFEGLRFDFMKMLNQRFALSHSVIMGSMEVPSQSSDVIKVPSAHYEFGANFLDPKLMLIGRVLTDGRMNARVRCDLTDNLALKIHAQLTNEPHFSQGMFQFDYKGKDYRSLFQIGNNAFYGANYIQSVTPHLSLGGEIFWIGHQRKSGIGFAARYNTDKMVATAQVATTGIVGLSYVQKISEKVSLASDFMYNQMSRDVTSTFGYDYILRQCRLRGKIDTNGVVSALLEERLNMGVTLLLSAEIDHVKKDNKFGFGLTVGE